MSGPISLKGNPYDVAWMMRWLDGDDVKPLDWARRCPTTQDECEAAFVKYRAITLMNTDDQAEMCTQSMDKETGQDVRSPGGSRLASRYPNSLSATALNDDAQADYDQEKREGWCVP